MITAPALRPARPAEAEKIADLLARAYAADPVFLWLLERRAASTLPRLFNPLVRWFARGGSVTVAADPVRLLGAAVWSPTTGRRPLGTTWGGLFPGRGGDPLVRLLWSHTARERQPTRPHRHLVLLGVEPGRGGEGSGTRLLAAGLAGCDARRLGAYTEVNTPSAVGFFLGHDFEVVAEGPLMAGAPDSWGLWRHPR